ncbi:MAG: hypothetical protein K0R12_1021 [Gammaproteobacteria bacterium]|jgi:hypothetical protein|nr:hypothetical protein [Gammaproteobacteria bacterium]
MFNSSILDLETITVESFLDALKDKAVFSIQFYPDRALTKFAFSAPVRFFDKTQPIEKRVYPDDSPRVEVLIHALADFISSRLKKKLMTFEQLIVLLHYLLQVNVANFGRSDKEDFSHEIKIYLMDLYKAIADNFFKQDCLLSFFDENIKAKRFTSDHFIMLIRPLKVAEWDLHIEETYTVTCAESIASTLVAHVPGMAELLMNFSESQWAALSRYIGLCQLNVWKRVSKPHIILADYWQQFLIEGNSASAVSSLGIPGQVWFAEQNMLRFAYDVKKLSLPELELLLEDFSLQAKRCAREAFIMELKKVIEYRRSAEVLASQTAIQSSKKLKQPEATSSQRDLCILQ